MSDYRVTLTNQYAFIEQSFRDLDRAMRQAETWKLKLPDSNIKIDRMRENYDAAKQ